MRNPQNKREQYQLIVEQGFRILKEKKAYRQVNILKKLKTLDLEVSPTSFSNILQGKTIGNEVLCKAAEGVLQIIKTELAWVFEESSQSFLPVDPSTAPQLIAEYDRKHRSNQKDVVFRADGRLNVGEKVAFIESAQKEIVEVGVRLNTFSNYFSSRKEKDFALPIKNILERNVNIKLYLLNPDYNGTHFYFNDRAIVQEEEKKSIERIKTVIQQLKKIYHHYQFDLLPGCFEIYTYRHLPYAHFLIVDGSRREGRMIVSQYLYGIQRANCPSVEVAKMGDPELYKKYWTSYKSLVSDAKLLDINS